MFKTLTESVAKERPEVRARIITNGDNIAAKRDAVVRSATGGTDEKVVMPKVNTLGQA